MSAITDWLDHPEAARGIHLMEPDGTWRLCSYQDLALRTLEASAFLAGADPRHSGVVSIILTDPESFVVAFMATMRAGLVPSPLAPPTAFRRRIDRYENHLAAVFAVSRPIHVICDASLAEHAARGLKAADVAASVLVMKPHGLEPTSLAGSPATRRGAPVDTDLALLEFTSGSTGTPRAVCISHDALLANVESITSSLGISERDAGASWLPLYHDMGLVGATLVPFTMGLDLWLMTPEQFVRSPVRWLECLGRHGASGTTSPSFGYDYVARRVRPEQVANLDFSNWRFALLGAERIDPAAIHRFQALVGPRGFDPAALVGAYGLAESTLIVSGCRPGSGSRLIRGDSAGRAGRHSVDVVATGSLGVDDVGGAGWLASCGTPLSDTTVTICDESGESVPPGTVGEIVVRGPSVALGYLTASGLQPFVDETHATGDAGVLIEGELYVIGRIGDAMKVRGSIVYAEDIETDIASMPPCPSMPCAVVLGATRDQSHVVVLLVEGAVSDSWLEAATSRISILTADLANTLVLRGRPGSIARTSSGKPRRRLMWEELTAGQQTSWVRLRGTVPAEMNVSDYQSHPVRAAR